MRRTHTFPAVAESVHAARRFATDELDGEARATREAVELLVSELATNCIRHEHASFHVTVMRSGAQVRVEVTDGGGGQPQMRSPGPQEPSGRGLQIVDMLSDRWGIAPEAPAGKTVWFELDLTEDASTSAEPTATGHGTSAEGSSEHSSGDRGRVPEPARGDSSRSTVQGRRGSSCERTQGSRWARRYSAHERCRDARRRRRSHRRAEPARSH